jgi:hypothetical protein
MKKILKKKKLSKKEEEIKKKREEEIEKIRLELMEFILKQVTYTTPLLLGMLSLLFALITWNIYLKIVFGFGGMIILVLAQLNQEVI